jgi:endoglucanase
MIAVHDMNQTLVVNLNQASIDGIRAAGATKQYIHVEGNEWNGAWTWTTGQNSATMGALTDPSNLIVYQMHQYLDTDGSGTHAECVSATIGQERVVAATQWLRANQKLGFIGEFAGGPNAQCQAAVKGMLDYMSANTDVWQGALWWAAGPWWAGKLSFRWSLLMREKLTGRYRLHVQHRACRRTGVRVLYGYPPSSCVVTEREWGAC